LTSHWKKRKENYPGSSSEKGEREKRKRRDHILTRRKKGGRPLVRRKRKKGLSTRILREAKREKVPFGGHGKLALVHRLGVRRKKKKNQELQDDFD